MTESSSVLPVYAHCEDAESGAARGKSQERHAGGAAKSRQVPACQNSLGLGC